MISGAMHEALWLRDETIKRTKHRWLDEALPCEFKGSATSTAD